jgi:hypothetical protein
MQLLNIKHGGTVRPGVTREYGPARLVVSQGGELFEGISHESQIWMSHSDTVSDLPAGVRVIATNEDGVPVALQFAERCWGIQFHPEVTHSHEGTQILKNFLTRSGAKLAPFDIQQFKAQMLDQIRADVGDREVVCGVSGGVDSTVLAVLHDIEAVRRHFPETLLLAREKVAHGATDTVLTAENLFRARQMSEAFDDDANVCARPAEQPAKRGAA